MTIEEFREKYSLPNYLGTLQSYYKWNKRIFFEKIIKQLDIKRSCCLLAGPRKCGKTTLMYQVAYYYKDSSVYIDMKDILDINSTK